MDKDKKMDVWVEGSTDIRSFQTLFIAALLKLNVQKYLKFLISIFVNPRLSAVNLFIAINESKNTSNAESGGAEEIPAPRDNHRFTQMNTDKRGK